VEPSVIPAFRVSELVVLGYLGYLFVLAWGADVPPRRRWLVVSLAVADAGLIWWVAHRSGGVWLGVRNLLPALHILVGYWMSGAFFTAPMPRVEAWLRRSDRWLFDVMGFSAFVTRAPWIVLEAFELAYLSVYFILPLGFVAAWAIDPGLDADRFWTVVTLAELACYGLLPWVQTRPPRALHDHVAIVERRHVIRPLNHLVLRHGSIQVNTFPSGHAAGATAVALAMADVSAGAAAAFAVLAAGIVFGSVIGRYHYAADSAAGVMVAILAWLITR
jgi:membrane-associated phospholipid phosphatase